MKKRIVSVVLALVLCLSLAMSALATGTTTTTFSPDQTCTRGQIVTLLYRDLM